MNVKGGALLSLRKEGGPVLNYHPTSIEWTDIASQRFVKLAWTVGEDVPVVLFA